MGQVHQLRPTPVAGSFVFACERFVTQHTGVAWSPGTADRYRETLTRLATELGPVDLVELDTPAGALRLGSAFTTAFGHLAPATYARHLSTLRSAVTWWRTTDRLHTDPTLGWPRPKIVVDHTRALSLGQVEALFRLDVAVRERTLWRMLYETAGRANEILLLDIADLDRGSNRAKVTGKGGNIAWVHWQTGTARLLPHLLAGRTTGPVFLADRRPTRPTPAADLCPDTGRARLSYRRAAELFDKHTVALAHPEAVDLDELGGWDLHQLRHSTLTHDAENGTSTPMLLARSRHASVRSLERYARPSVDAVARHVAGRDPAARRRTT